MSDISVGSQVRFWPAGIDRRQATVIEVEQNPLTGKWRYRIEYVGAITGETTTQWVGRSAIDLTVPW